MRRSFTRGAADCAGSRFCRTSGLISRFPLRGPADDVDGPVDALPGLGGPGVDGHLRASHRSGYTLGTSNDRDVRMKKLWILALVLALVPGAALAAGPGAVRKQIESSMLVRGEIEIDAQGRVSKLLIDQPENLPSGIPEFVKSQLLQWQFEPVLRDGQPTPARSRMSVRLVGKRIDDKSATIAVRNADFPGPEPGEGEAVTHVSMKPPSYPMPAIRAGAQGTAYLVLKISREGAVADAIVEQVNLRVVGSESQMTRLRDMFAKASLTAARRWTFKPPTRGEAAGEEFWSVRVPVEYTMDEATGPARYGKWHAYVPGPRQAVPWSEEAEAAGFSPDAMAEGGVYMAGTGTGLRLLTPLNGG